MKNIDIFNEKYLPETGGINWPNSAEEREVLARTIFGLGFVEAHDYWINNARKIMDANGPQFPRAFVREKQIRKNLESLSEEQREAVINLVQSSVHGALFSALVSIDQYPRADLAIQVIDEESGNEPISIAPANSDLHDQFFDWLSKFSSEATDAP